MELVKKGVYRHYKGNLYAVVDLATHSESLEKMVVYRALYGDFGLWIRPLSIFLEKIEFNGKIQNRFEWVSET